MYTYICIIQRIITATTTTTTKTAASGTTERQVACAALPGKVRNSWSALATIVETPCSSPFEKSARPPVNEQRGAIHLYYNMILG